MANEKVPEEEESESQDIEDEDEDIEKMLEELEEEELEEEELEREEIEESQTEIKTGLEDDIDTKDVEMTSEGPNIQQQEKPSTIQNSTEARSLVAQIPTNGDIDEVELPIEIEEQKNIEAKETLMSDQAIDALDAIQDKKIKDQFEDLPAYIEAILFEVGKPLKESELVDLLFERFKADRNRIRWGLRKVMRALEAQNSSIQLINPTKDFWSFQLHRQLSDEFLHKVEKFIPEEEFISKRETVFLTEIAYRQPVSTTDILKILGTDGYDYIRSLEEKDLIYMTKDGQSNILRTTEKFAQLFGFDPELRSLKLQLVWRLKKLARSEAVRDKATLAQLKEDREKYGS